MLRGCRRTRLLRRGSTEGTIFQRLVTDLDGDDGFIKRTQVAIRRPVFYGDTTYVTGTVEKSSKMCMWATMRLVEC